MLRSLLLIALVVGWVSCLGQNEKKSDSRKEAVSYSRHISFVDIEHSGLESPVAPLVVIDEVTDTAAIGTYIEKSQITYRGNKAKMQLVFDVPGHFSVLEIGKILGLTDKFLTKYFPEFDGTLEVLFVYSSKSDDWLQLPEPPKR